MPSVLQSFETTPAEVTHAATVIEGLDGCLAAGFARLGAEQLAALDSLARVFRGTPLEAPVVAANKAIRRSEFLEKYLVSLAAARGALLGSVHDALSARAASALGRGLPSEAPKEEAEAQALPGNLSTLLESCRQWLLEVALAGFLQLSAETVLPFAATLERLQDEPLLLRQAAVLTGFFEELSAAIPLELAKTQPIYRWADLWSRSMLLCAQQPAALSQEKTSGELLILGVALRHHPHLVSLIAYGVLQNKAGARWVRCTVTTYKVDLVVDAELWRVLADDAPILVKAIEEQTSLQLKEMTLLSSGDLCWDESKAKKGKAFSPMSTAESLFAPGAKSELIRSALPGIARHPALFFEPLFLSGFTVTSKEEALYLQLDGASLRIAKERLSDASELTSADLSKSQSLFGLLCFDRGVWGVEPLAITTTIGKKTETLFVGRDNIKSLAKSKSDVLAVLKERASKLLRAKR